MARSGWTTWSRADYGLWTEGRIFESHKGDILIKLVTEVFFSPGFLEVGMKKSNKNKFFFRINKKKLKIREK